MKKSNDLYTLPTKNIEIRKVLQRLHKINVEIALKKFLVKYFVWWSNLDAEIEMTMPVKYAFRIKALQTILQFVLGNIHVSHGEKYASTGLFVEYMFLIVDDTY